MFRDYFPIIVVIASVRSEPPFPVVIEQGYRRHKDSDNNECNADHYLKNFREFVTHNQTFAAPLIYRWWQWLYGSIWLYHWRLLYWWLCYL